MAGAAGYFGGKKKNSLLARSENSYGNITATYSADRFLEFTRSDRINTSILGASMLEAREKLKHILKLDPSGLLNNELLAREIGFNISESEDTGMFSGDRDKDIIDRMNGEFYSDSLTNSMLNILTGGNFTRTDETREGLIGIKNAAALYMTYQDEGAQEKHQKKLLSLS